MGAPRVVRETGLVQEVPNPALVQFGLALQEMRKMQSDRARRLGNTLGAGGIFMKPAEFDGISQYAVLKAGPNDVWRRCFRCGGIEVLIGNPELHPETPKITFKIIQTMRHGSPVRMEHGATVECSNCGNIQWAQ
jgi:hypothetical protein